MSVCSSCGGEIVWATTTNDRQIPLNPKPEPNGNLEVIVIDGRRFAQTPSLASDPEQLYISHFATCPDAEEHRSSR